MTQNQSGNQLFHFDVDIAHNKANDEYFRDTRRIQVSAMGLAILMFAIGGTAAWRLGLHNVGLLLLVAFAVIGLIFVAVAIRVPRLVGSPQRIYDTYPLVPAMIAEIKDDYLVLLALVNTNIDPDETPRWGLAARRIHKISGHKLSVGERVPAVAVSGRQKAFGGRGQWSEITILPIAWGTPDQKVIARASHVIPSAQWWKLKHHLGDLEEVMKARYLLMPLDK